MKNYKIVNPDGHNGLVYKEGVNTDPLPWNPKGTCEYGGIYFAREDILAFIGYGTELYEVTPIGEIYEDPDDRVKKYKAHSVNLKYIGPLEDNIEFLIKQGANINVCENVPIYYATRYGDIKIFNILVKAGAITDDNVKRMVIKTAIETNQPEIVKMLIKDISNMININETTNVHEFINKAITYNNIEVVSVLIQAGVDIWNNNNIAIETAIAKGYENMIKLIINSGINPYKNVANLLNTAIRYQQSDMYLMIADGIKKHKIKKYKSNKILLCKKKRKYTNALKISMKHHMDLNQTSNQEELLM